MSPIAWIALFIATIAIIHQIDLELEQSRKFGDNPKF